MKFPKTIAAVQKRDRCMWEIGDALIAECGEPSTDGITDGSNKKIEQAAIAIETVKVLDYSISTLVKIRDTAFAFPHRARRASLAWSAHKTPPERRVTPPTPKEATGLAFLAESLRQGVVVSRCTRDMEGVAEWLEKNLDKLETVEIDDLVDSCLSLAETAFAFHTLASPAARRRRAPRYAAPTQR